MIARQTAAHSPEGFVKIFGERLQALAAKYLIQGKSWSTVVLPEGVAAK